MKKSLNSIVMACISGVLYLQELYFIICMLWIIGCLSSSRHSISSSTQGMYDPQPITELVTNKNLSVKDATDPNLITTEALPENSSECPSFVDCHKLGGECITCKFNHSCVYGQETTVECEAHKSPKCLGEKRFNKTFVCRYCYQTETWEHSCTPKFSCRVVSNPRARELTNCSVKSEVICLGNRVFCKNPLCNWTYGYKWSTALILSITLGGFGADRFYLGHWQEGIGKLFSFGGLGIWTLLDVILISVGYLSPADGSLYI